MPNPSPHPPPSPGQPTPCRAPGSLWNESSDGTPLQGHQELTPHKCLRILAMIRFVHGAADVRVSAGREQHLRTLQPLSLEICNSLFLGDYLTSEGQAGQADLDMLADGGYTIHGADAAPSRALPRTEVRRRGAGTAAAANT